MPGRGAYQAFLISVKIATQAVADKEVGVPSSLMGAPVHFVLNQVLTTIKPSRKDCSALGDTSKGRGERRKVRLILSISSFKNAEGQEKIVELLLS